MTTFERSDSEVEILSREMDNLKQSTGARETTPLLVSRETERQERGCSVNIQARCRRRCCLRSKAAWLILLWNLIIVTSLSTFCDPSFYVYNIDSVSAFKAVCAPSFLIIPALYGISAFLLLFYPLAGCLADIRWGRYKTIIYGVHIVLWSFTLIVLFSGTMVVVMFAYGYTAVVKDVVLLSVPFIPGVIIIICGFVAFSANVIQFGTDQLHDASSDDNVLYIHWYVWTSYLGVSLIKICISFLPVQDKADSLYLLPLVAGLYGIIIIAMFFLGVTLCIHKYKRNQWLLIDSGSRNPYKLVYKVIKFAAEHKTPIRRSAFTYCEDEVPSRLDLGKEKYGGPFTTEQVEDVKAFLGILSILLSLGPILMVDIAVSGILTKFADQVHDRFDGSHFKHLLIKNGGLTSLMIVILIPLYLSLLRPFIHNYIPGMLKRIGLGMIFILLSALCTLSLDTYEHAKASSSVPCFATYTPNTMSVSNDAFSLEIGSDILIIQSCLNTVGYLLLYIAIYEFICAQSPHSMKGLLIGTFFAIKGVFQLFGIAVIYVPFTQWEWQLKFPSCGFVYYLINVVIGIVGIVAYTCVARKYQYRQRDEPDNIYRYAEEYYANVQEEPNYDYDDYDNLNVQTIT